jgi:hypothetical protein
LFGHDARFAASDNRVGKEVHSMQDEAEITINGTKLTDSESMTVRVAIDTLANVLAEDLSAEGGQAVADRYMAALTKIQTLLDSRQTRKQ